MEVAERIRAEGARLTVAERRVATAVLDAPQLVAFGTVADLARSAQVGAASVVRLANKLGFDGYSELQQAIQGELSAQLRPAAERIHDSSNQSITAHDAAKLANVRATLSAVGDTALTSLVERLADVARPVLVVSGDATAGVGRLFADQMGQLRPGVEVVQGSEVAVRRAVALADPESTAVVIDLRRYERWVLDAHAAIDERGIWSVALTDGVLSPLAQRADVTFLVTAGSIGPFDSHVGTLAVLDLITNSVADALRATAADRLGAIESAWGDAGALTDGA